VVVYKMVMCIDRTQDWLYDVYCTIRLGWGDDYSDIVINAKSNRFINIITIYVK